MISYAFNFTLKDRYDKVLFAKSTSGCIFSSTKDLPKEILENPYYPQVKENIVKLSEFYKENAKRIAEYKKRGLSDSQIREELEVRVYIDSELLTKNDKVELYIDRLLSRCLGYNVGNAQDVQECEKTRRNLRSSLR